MKYELEQGINNNISKKDRLKQPSYEAFIQWHSQQTEKQKAASADAAKHFLEHFEEYVLYDNSTKDEKNEVMAINKPPYINSHGNGKTPPYGVSELARIATGNARLTTIHRLDRDTTGVLLLGKTKKAITEISTQFARTNGTKEVQKTYLALVEGHWNEKITGVVIPIAKTETAPRVIFPHEETDDDLVSKPQSSATGIRVVGSFVDEQNNSLTLLQLQLFTGRMHQIRLATSYLGHPISGDPQYNSNSSATDRQLLHAYELSLRQPGTTPEEGKRLHFHAPLPSDFQEKLTSMKSHQITEPSLSYLVEKS